MSFEGESMGRFFSCIKSSTAVATAVMVATLTLAVPAHAQSSVTAIAVSAENESQVLNCAGRWANVLEATNVRTNTRLDSTIVGIAQKGQTVCVTGGTDQGAQYTACGKTSRVWYSIVWQNVHNNRWVAGSCMNYV